MAGWSVKLDGTLISEDCETDIVCDGDPVELVGWLDGPPDMALTQLRTEDITYAQRDGVTHFNDWYPARIITLANVTTCNDDECNGCGTTGSARQKMRSMGTAWDRTCCDTEVVIYTDCNGQYVEGEPTLGSQTLRRNRVLNPSFEDPTILATGWRAGISSGGAVTTSVETSGGFSGSNFFRATRNAGGTWLSRGFQYNSSPASLSDIAVPVAPGEQLSSSMYFRTTGTGISLTASVKWWSNTLGLISTETGSPVLVNGSWTRVSVLGAVAPAGSDYAELDFLITAGTLGTGETIDADAALFEVGTELLPYFDGGLPDSDDPVVGGQKLQYAWRGVANQSVSIESSQTYQENLDRSLYGPFGVVGRPRVFSPRWLGNGLSCAETLLRFDGVDQLAYVLDECGTPGYGNCTDVFPGTEVSVWCGPLCGTTGLCASEPLLEYSVPPAEITIKGTEAVSPTITLYPGLTQPRIQNLTTGESILFNAPVIGSPVIIDTKEGTATQDGNSVTYLLQGSLFFSWAPGTYELQMLSQSNLDDGYAQVCWRDAVVMI